MEINSTNGNLDDCQQVWTIDDVSRFLRIPRKSIYLLCQRGEIPCAKFGRHWRFCREIVEEWFRNRMQCKSAVVGRADKPGSRSVPEKVNA